MENKGYDVNFQRGQVFTRSEEVSPDIALRIGVQDGNLYKLQDQPVQALMHTSESLWKLWHKRMGHLHHRGLPLLRQMVIGLPNFNLDHQGVCRGCALSKNVKAPFPSNKTRSKGILDLIHSYVGGPMWAASVKSASYYVTFIHDFSKKSWIYFKKTKYEVFNHFRAFEARVENMTRRKIKALRTDNGGEFTST
jgi:hypothetical protein